ncbi:hypothetical protein CDD80_2525 [Ophiocordyceps camponoti-rufipedis]|uniref:Uncharacterized protein n=1 Tax=Ophiocordyceps camponoti-rufipedis TaxID=2004952 RepID=A0A2C5Z5F7_9HYPO|nr:hypothetical protein CDD80_2525 [Ophiocordyceps camponoti-rufipedis]
MKAAMVLPAMLVGLASAQMRFQDTIPPGSAPHANGGGGLANGKGLPGGGTLRSNLNAGAPLGRNIMPVARVLPDGGGGAAARISATVGRIASTLGRAGPIVAGGAAAAGLGVAGIAQGERNLEDLHPDVAESARKGLERGLSEYIFRA